MVGLNCQIILTAKFSQAGRGGVGVWGNYTKVDDVCRRPWDIKGYVSTLSNGFAVISPTENSMLS